jgi:hypothetical protein
VSGSAHRAAQGTATSTRLAVRSEHRAHVLVVRGSCGCRTRLQAVMEQRSGGRSSAHSLAFAFALFALFAVCGVGAWRTRGAPVARQPAAGWLTSSGRGARRVGACL